MVCFISILLYLLSFFAAFTTAMPTPIEDEGTEAPDILAASDASRYCAVGYYNNIPGPVRLESNTCGSVHPNPEVKVTRAENGDCRTCWFFE